MTRGEWELRAQDHALSSEPLHVDPSGYAELVRLRLAHDPLDMADHTSHLMGVPLILDL